MTTAGTTLATAFAAAETDQQLLIEVTNWDSPTATTINTTRLADACDRAINQWQIDMGDYDPTTYPLHQQWIREWVWLVLHQRANRWKDCEARRAVIDEYKKALGDKRRMAPASSSPFTPTNPNPNNISLRPAFDDSIFDGYTG